MIVSRLAYLMGVQISTSYAAAFSFPGDLLPEFPLKLKRARGCGGDTLARSPRDRYGDWKPNAETVEEIKKAIMRDQGVDPKTRLTTSVVRLADFYERIFILIEKGVIDGDVFLETNQDYNIVASYYVLEHALWALAAESYEWDDFRKVALMARDHYKKRPGGNANLSNASFEKIPMNLRGAPRRPAC